MQRRGLQKLWRAPRGRRRRADVGFFGGLGIEQAALQLDRGFCPARTIIYTEDAGQYRRWMELYADTDCRFYDREWRGAIHFIMTTGQEDIQAVLPGQS